MNQTPAVQSLPRSNHWDNMTPVERLTMALKLAIDAPAGREADADKLVQALAAGLSEFEIETAKRAALKGQA